MKIAIIGTGPSGYSSGMEFLKKGFKVEFFDFNKNSKKKIPKIKNVSPKLNNQEYLNGNSIFYENYKIKKNKFILTSYLGIGGLSNFWGGGIEIPENEYLNKFYKKKELKIEMNNVLNSFYPQELFQKKYKKFYDQDIVNNFLKPEKNIKVQKFLIALNKSNKKIYSTINDTNNKRISNKIKIKNYFVKNIVNKEKKLSIICQDINNNNFHFDGYDKVIIACGTVGSTLLVSKILDFKKKIFRLSHTPTVKFAYLGIRFKKFSPYQNKINYPLLKISAKVKKKIIKGSLFLLENLNNEWIGFSKKNFIVKFLKKNIVAGFYFLPHYTIDTKINILEGDVKITYKLKNTYITMLKLVKKITDKFFINKKFISIPFFSWKLNSIGSDAHYTSSLYLHDKKKKIFNKLFELKKMKNCHVLDGSVLPPGLSYPTFMTMVNSKAITKLILNEKIKN